MAVGRPVNDSLLRIYILQKHRSFSKYIHLSDRVSVSSFNTLSLSEYCDARQQYCSLYHSSICHECSSMVKAGRMILEGSLCSLRAVFTEAFPRVTYHTLNAKRRLLQMPVVAIQVQCQSSAEILVTELINGIDYLNVLRFLDDFIGKAGSHVSKPSLSKDKLAQILSLSRSDRERELIKCTAFLASGISSKSARNHFGFSNLPERIDRLQKAIQEAGRIGQCIESLSDVQERAFIQTLGIVAESGDSSDCNSEDDSSDCNSEDDDSESILSIPKVDEVHIQPSSVPVLQHDDENELLTLDDNRRCLSPSRSFEALRESEFNWFELVDRLIVNTQTNEDKVVKFLDDFFSVAMDSDCVSENDKVKLNSSYQAFKLDEGRRALVDREANALNGLIVSDDESENPDDYIGLEAANEKARQLLAKKKKQLSRRNRYLKCKELAERNFLSRRVSKKVSRVLEECPNIGNEVESFVQECSIGADAWRRTGVLTFDGNSKVKSKVTYERIRRHLIKVYNRTFSYGTVVQLCIARNKRRLSSKRYKGVCKVTSRRARKGFMLKYNPDAHWSAAFYRNLNIIQYTDGRHILNINRDDAAGFRLDTMATHRLHRTPMVKGSECVTTYTDYVSKYKAVLQTTSYNFSKTDTTLELCAGIVKPQGVFPKNPIQHMSDLEMLETKTEIKQAFVNPLTDEKKLIECFRVDGATDEGPSHEEIQFLWTVRHMSRPTVATLVTARSSGSSYLNRVELQNGSLALAHANLFIPSTLDGSCMESGGINEKKYKQNMELATDVYISRVNGCPCGNTVIHLYKGADATEKLVNRKYILQYLKGSKSQLKKDNPNMYEYCDRVWKIKQSHVKPGLPSNYIFFLVCCFDEMCSHPLCSKVGSHTIDLPKWFESGPSVSYLPLPIPDPARYYGNPDCEECKGFCYGHFMKPHETLNSTLLPMSKPPSVILKAHFDALNTYPPSELEFSSLSKKVMLPIDEVKIWFDHLHTIRENRRKGASKAVITKRRNKPKPATINDPPVEVKESDYQCGVCHTPYQSFTETEEKWIGCDKCDTWYHFTCVGIDCHSDEPETYLCSECI